MTPEDLQQIRAVIKDEIAVVKDEITAAITAAEVRAQAALAAAEERAQEFARGIETNLLTAFHGHARG